MTPELHVELAARLRAAHRQVTALDVGSAEKALLVRRLMALTEVSKRDMERASARLDALLADLDAGRPAQAPGDERAP